MSKQAKLGSWGGRKFRQRTSSLDVYFDENTAVPRANVGSAQLLEAILLYENQELC